MVNLLNFADSHGLGFIINVKWRVVQIYIIGNRWNQKPYQTKNNMVKYIYHALYIMLIKMVIQL